MGGASSAWAETTIYSWEGGSEGATQTGGTVAVSDGSSTSDAINEATATIAGTYYVIKLQSKNDAKTGYTYITLDQALQENDQIKISGFQNKNATDKQVNIKLLFYQNDTEKGNITEASDANWVNLFNDQAYANAEEPETKTFNVTAALAGSNVIRIFRAKSGTNLWINKIEVTRAAPSTDPTITVSPTSTSIETTESGVEATENITVTGANLTGSTLTATLSPAVDGLSVTLGSNTITDGAISTTATLHYTQIENASGSTTLTLSDGTTSKEITVNYTSSVETWTLQTINSARTWDFSTLTGGKLYEGDDVNVEHVYANITEIGCPVSFDGTALAFTGQYPFRDNSHKYAQAGTLRFNTSVPGQIVVKFSDTGTSASASAVKRYLVVNSETTEYWTSRENNGDAPYPAQLNVTTGAIAVPAGDVTIGGTSGLIYQQVIFTPCVSKTISAAGWATYCSPYALDLENATGLTDAYIVTGATGNVLNTTSVKGGTIPANTGILIEAPEGTVTIPVVASSETNVSGNKFQGVTTATEISANAGYVLMADPSLGFYKNTNAFTVGANTAYLPANITAGAARSAYFIGGNITAVDNVEAAAKVKALPVKRIVNGKLIIEKKGAIFNAAGQMLSK